MLYTTEIQLVSEIADWLKKHLSIEMLSAKRINRGLMNEKWILNSSKGSLFVKSYHPGRYKMDSPEFRDKLENALQLQLIFYQSGGACPEPLMLEGNCLHILPCGRFITVMTCSPGTMSAVGKFGEYKMRTLGRATANMHKTWDSAVALELGIAMPLDEPIWGVTREEMEHQWESRWDEAIESNCSERVKHALQLQKTIVDSLDDEIFTPPTAGWTHLDLWSDNLLFEGNSLAAIVDFDRVRYSFPVLDIGRAVLSGTLNLQGFHKKAVAAFCEGYSSIRSLPSGSILTAIKYVWCIESFWWIKPSMESYSVAPARFLDEMIYIAEHWEKLDYALGEI